MKILKNVTSFFKKIIKFFETTEGTSYWIPISKLVIGTVTAIIGLSLSNLLVIENPIVDLIVVVLVKAPILFLIICYCFYTPISEFIIISENKGNERKKKAPPQEAQCVEKTFDETIQLAEKNDIIEIEIVSGGKLLTIGTSSDTDKPFGNMIDKKYYVEKCEYDKIEDFSEAINPLFKDGVVLVYSIDGIRLKKKKQPKK